MTTHGTNMGGIRLPAYQLVETLIKALCLRYGCTPEEVETIKASPSGPGLHPCLASVKAGDGREILRLGSIKELDDVIRCEHSCRYLAKAVRNSSDIGSAN